MKSLYTNECLRRLYTPLTYEESLPYIDTWHVSNKTAFDKSVVVIKSISNDGTVHYIEKEMKTVKVIPANITENGGETLPLKNIMVNDFGSDSKLKKGRMVYSNVGVILGKDTERPVLLWVDKYHQYSLTSSEAIYTVIMDDWSPYCATNLGKYGMWNPEHNGSDRNG